MRCGGACLEDGRGGRGPVCGRMAGAGLTHTLSGAALGRGAAKATGGRPSRRQRWACQLGPRTSWRAWWGCRSLVTDPLAGGG